MTLKTRLFGSFLIIVIMPVAILLTLAVIVAKFQAREFEERYGVDLTMQNGDSSSFILMIVTCLIFILVITALLLNVWIHNAITSPIIKLSKAAENIRDGNLDFTLEPEGVREVRELGEGFEEMRIRLKAANAENGRFDAENRELISNIAHDLKTPIAAVKGYSEGIMDGVADTPEKMEKYIRTIYNKANEMDHLINELTFYSKIDTNRIPYNFRRVNVQDFFADAVEELQLELEEKNVAFRYGCHVDPGTEVIADAEQFGRVIHNIISNSLKYMDKPNKEIAIRIYDSGDEVVAAIEDNGMGISQKDISHIFDRFYRTDSSRHSPQKGSGIGLSIVKKIMEDHGGRVWTVSKEGVGTVMYLSLRKYMENTEPSPDTGAEKRSGPKNKAEGRRKTTRTSGKDGKSL